MTLLSIEDLTVTFRGERGETTAIEDVSLELAPGEILGIVGESGSGKSVTALSVMGLLPEPAAKVMRGRVVFEGKVLTGMAEHRLRRLRGPGMGMVFQEPMTSLNPVFSIGEQITETLRAHGENDRRKRLDIAVEMLDRVGIPSAIKRLNDYPHQLSGGQRQRVMIAMALACRPRLLIADEPTTALDLTIQAGILDLILDLREQFGMAVLMITHNMGVIAEVADRVAVMYAGRVVEQAPVEPLFAAPGHPYTRALLACVPALDDDRERLAAIPGSLPDPRARPPGCRYAPRCALHLDECDRAIPPLLPMAERHEAACIRLGVA